MNLREALKFIEEEYLLSISLMVRLQKQAKDAEQVLLSKEIANKLSQFPAPFEEN